MRRPVMNRNFVNTFCWLAACGALLLTQGCKSMTPGELDRVQPTSDRQLAGNVYLLRGFIGIWSYGIDHLGKKVEEAGIRASVYQENQWAELADKIAIQYKNAQNPEPLILIGHSYGADDALRIAKRLEDTQIDVDLIITLDPVTPPHVPKNVKLCYNIYQPNMLDNLPFFRGIALETDGTNNLMNVNIRQERRDLLEPDTDHFNIEKNVKIHEEVVKKLKEFCPPRQSWATHVHPAAHSSLGSSAGNNLDPGNKVETRRVGAADNYRERIP